MAPARRDDPAARSIGGRLGRRTALRFLLVGAGTTVLAACAPSTPAPGPTAAAARPTEAPGPARPTAPPAAKPAEAAKPAAAATPAPAAKPAAQPRSGGTLRVGVPGDISTLDGHILTQNAYDTIWLVFDRLTAYDLKLQPQPMLAESWDLSSDLKQIKLNLRKGVTWHSGREFTSEDVKWNLTRVRDRNVASGNFVNQSNWFTSIDTPDKNTIILKSEQPRPAIWDFFEYFNILDRETMEGPDAKTRAIGTGPFTLVEWIQGNRIRLARNKNYWQSGRPLLDEVLVTVQPDPQSNLTQLEAGALDVIKSPPLTDFARLKSDPKFQAILNQGSGQNYLVAANVLNQPLDNKKVRQALNYALNRKRFTDTMLLGIVPPKVLPWSQASPAYEPAKEEQVTFDLQKAKALLAEAGVSGFEMDILLLPDYPELLDFAQVYQADLATLGIKLNIRKLELAGWLDQVNNRKYVGLYATAGTYSQMEPVTQFTNSRGYDPGGNNSGFKNDHYTRLVAQAASEADTAKRKQIYAQLNDLLLDECFITSMAWGPARLAARANVKDIGFTLHEGFYWTDVWLDA